MPTHDPNMSSTLAIVRLLQQIEQTIHTIPKLIQHLLMSDNPDYQATMSTIRSPQGTRLILNSLLHACHSTVTEWVIEVAMEMFRHEILKASDIEMGLHLKASQACSSPASQKACMILLIMANSTNFRCNAFQAVQGFFLESTNTPERIINVLAHGGWCVSMTLIANIVKTLTKE